MGIPMGSPIGLAERPAKAGLHGLGVRAFQSDAEAYRYPWTQRSIPFGSTRLVHPFPLRTTHAPTPR